MPALWRGANLGCAGIALAIQGTALIAAIFSPGHA
jgi:hypothetical protein